MSYLKQLALLAAAALATLLLTPLAASEAATQTTFLPTLFTPVPTSWYSSFEADPGAPAVLLDRVLALPTGQLLYAGRQPGPAWLLAAGSPATVAWESRYLPEAAAHDVVDTGNGIVLASAVSSDGALHPLLSWLDAAGAVRETYRYRRADGAAFDGLDGVERLADGDILVSLSSQSRVWLLRLDAAAQVVWSRDYTTQQSVDHLALAADPLQNGLYVLMAADGGAAALLARLDPQGAVLWARRLQVAPGGYAATDLAAPVGGGVAVTGAIPKNGAYQYDTWLARLDGDGALTWAYRYLPGDLESEPRVLQAAQDGGVLLSANTGYTHPPHIYPADALVLKVDAAGQPQWHTRLQHYDYTTGSQMLPLDLLQRADGTVVASGYTTVWGGRGWAVALAPGGELADCPLAAHEPVSVQPVQAQVQPAQLTAAPVPVTREPATRTRLAVTDLATTIVQQCPPGPASCGAGSR